MKSGYYQSQYATFYVDAENDVWQVSASGHGLRTAMSIPLLPSNTRYVGQKAPSVVKSHVCKAFCPINSLEARQSR